MQLRDAFRDDGGDVCGAYFAASADGDVTGVTHVWDDVRRLASSRSSDDVVFWTVVAQHERLAVVLSTCITAALHNTRSSSSSSNNNDVGSHVVTPHDEAALVAVLVRLATTTEVCVQRNVDVASLASRLEALLPSRLLLPLAVLLLRRCAPRSGNNNNNNNNGERGVTAVVVDTRVAAVTLTSLLLLCPPLLCRLQPCMTNWSDDVDKLALRCVSEARRGRYQRSAGDVLALVSLAHRAVQPLWAALQCAPLLADYVPPHRTLRALRVLVDVVVPLVQHMVLVCDALTPRRASLTRACASVVNAAVYAAVLLLLFRTYSVVTDGGSDDAAQRTRQSSVWAVPAVVHTTYTTLYEYTRTHTTGYPRVLLDNWCRDGNSSNSKNIHTLMHCLVPPLLDDGATAAATSAAARGDVRLGRVLLALTAPLRDGGDFAAALRHDGGGRRRLRYAEAVLRALVQQGVQLRTLVRDGVVSVDEAQQLGATPDDCGGGDGVATSSQRAVAAAAAPHMTSSSSEAAKTHNTDDEDSNNSDSDDEGDATTRAAVQMVRSVFPQYTRRGVRAALAYYNKDAEQLILDASADNLPPHLAPLLLRQQRGNEAPRHVDPTQQQQTTAAVTAQPSSSSSLPPPRADADEVDVRDICRRILCSSSSSQYDDDVDNTNEDDDKTTRALHFGNDDVLYDAVLQNDGVVDNNNTTTTTTAAPYSAAALTLSSSGGGTGAVLGLSDAFRVDDDMREKIRMLDALMYEDEYDDNALDEAHMDDDAAAAVASDVDDDDNVALTPATTTTTVTATASPHADTAAAAAAGSAHRPRDVYHDKQWHAQRARERAAHVAATQQQRQQQQQQQQQQQHTQPAYAAKRKTTTTRTTAAAAAKTAKAVRRDGRDGVQRALRKGHVDVF